LVQQTGALHTDNAWTLAITHFSLTWNVRFNGLGLVSRQL